MRLLVVHNYYGSSAPSGENRAFEAERDLLRSHGHDVREHLRHSDVLRAQGALGTLRGGLATPWNPFAAARLRSVVEELRPDLVHVHNTFPMLSPAIFHAIPQEVRACSPYTMRGCSARPESPCATGGSAPNAWTEGPSSLRYATGATAAAGSPPSARQRDVARPRAPHLGAPRRRLRLPHRVPARPMVGAGLPAARAHVKPNSFPGHPSLIPWAERERSVVFAGRLDVAKGVHELVEAWLAWADAPTLQVVGTGPEEPALRERAGADPRIRFLGQRSFSEVEAIILAPGCSSSLRRSSRASRWSSGRRSRLRRRSPSRASGRWPRS